MARVDIDIDGRRENTLGNVMPKLVYPLTLGKPWLKKKRCCLSSQKTLLADRIEKHKKNGAG